MAESGSRFNRRTLMAALGIGLGGAGLGGAAVALRRPEPADKARVGLTEEERDDPLAPFFDRPSAPVAPEVQRALRRGPLPAEVTLRRADIARLDEPGYLDAETGFCSLPDGRGYVAVRTEMPGVTAEMIDWWFAWANRVDLRYKIWFPGLHYGNRVTEPTQEEAAELARRPARERKPYWFTTAHPHEDVGFGPEAISIRFVPPQDYGLANPAFATGQATAICAYTGADSIGLMHSHMCHYVRPIAGGVELRSRFWMGEDIHLVGAGSSASAIVLNTDFVRRRLINPNRPYDMAIHCAQEYANLAAILPELFRRYAG
jgi:hypothetical protein